jgi:hypothetical protein
MYPQYNNHMVIKIKANLGGVVENSVYRKNITVDLLVISL